MRLAKAVHLVFAPTGRLEAVLGAVVHACGRFDEDVLYPIELRNISLQGRPTLHRYRDN